MDNQHIPTPRNTREAVLLTLAYFDAQGLALTAFDVWFNLIKFEASYREVLAELSGLARTPATAGRGFGQGRGEAVVHCKDGYYSLRSPEAIELRQLKHKVSEFKWRRARIVAHVLSLVPFVEAAAVVDSVALNKAKPESDVDFFIVTRPGRMWSARIMVTALTHLLRLRRHGKQVRNRACLSFYATTDALGLEHLAIEGGDLYLAQWVYLVSPLWQRRGFDLIEHLTARNEWAAQIFPQRAGGELTTRRLVIPTLARLTRIVQWTGEKLLSIRVGRFNLGQWVEQRSRRLQLKYMHKSAPFELKTRTSHIVINDQMLKFHEQDRRTWFRQRTLATYHKLVAAEPLADAAIGLAPEQHIEIRFGEGRLSGISVQPVGATVGSTTDEGALPTPQSIIAGVPGA